MRSGYNEDIMMRRSSGIKSDIEKIKKLRALQEKATEKLNKITEKSAAKTRKKKRAAPAGKKKAKTAANKGALWKTLFKTKKKTEKRSQAPKSGKKRPRNGSTGSPRAGRRLDSGLRRNGGRKKGPLTFNSSPARGEDKKKKVSSGGFVFRHFGRG
jgi:hypothetical protein